MPKVSVIIPAYNSMTYLPETLKSVFRQTFTDLEVLIINDGSSDNIIQWVTDTEDPRVQLISQENQGVAAARNTGIAHAKGDYLAFLDADDFWEPTKLEKQVCYLESNSTVSLVHTWTLLIDSESRFIGKVLKSQAQGDVWQQLIQKNMIVASSVLVRYSALQTLGKFDEDLDCCEDYDMWIRFASRYDFAVVKELLTSYRLHPNTLSTRCEEVLESFRVVIERAFQSASTELLYLRNRSYGNLSLYLAWRYLNNTDYKQANYFRQQALAHYPQLRYSWQCIRLSLAIIIMQLLKPSGYQRVLASIYTLRRRISSMIVAISFT